MWARIDHLIDLALEEDAGLGDITSEAIFEAGQRSAGSILSRENLVVCGLHVAERVFARVDRAIQVTLKASEGDGVAAGQVLLEVEGPTASLLTAERTALNFLQRLCGIATLSRQFADRAERAGTGVRVVDTRKTTPGFRALEKYAVRVGGCFNHRGSLSDLVLIKENHIVAAGSISQAVQRCRRSAPHTAKVEVETETLEEVREAVDAGADIIMLDNMSPAQIAAAVEAIDGRALVEVSGGVVLENLGDFALPGVDIISVGTLTHGARSVDLSMRIAAGQGI